MGHNICCSVPGWRVIISRACLRACAVAFFTSLKNKKGPTHEVYVLFNTYRSNCFASCKYLASSSTVVVIGRLDVISRLITRQHSCSKMPQLWAPFVSGLLCLCCRCSSFLLGLYVQPKTAKKGRNQRNPGVPRHAQAIQPNWGTTSTTYY